MRVIPDRVASRRSPRSVVIGPWCEEFSANTLYGEGAAAAATSWPTANKPMALPFVVRVPFVVTKLGWVNGSSVTTNFDMGVYDASFNRLVSCGSTSRTGASVWQFVDVTDTALSVGMYYLAAVSDANTANNVLAVPVVGNNIMALFGGMDSNTDAFPLPNPLTNMAATSVVARLPVMAMITSGSPV